MKLAIIASAFAIVLTAAAAQAMRWDGFRPSTNIEDRRGQLAERPKPVTDLVARNWVVPTDVSVSGWLNSR